MTGALACSVTGTIPSPAQIAYEQTFHDVFYGIRGSRKQGGGGGGGVQYGIQIQVSNFFS